MWYKENITFLIISTAVILIPIAGSITFLVNVFVKTAYSQKDIKSKESKNKNKFKLLFIVVGILYGIFLECLLFWIIWISKLEVSQFVRIISLFMSLPYFIILFSIYYALGPAIVFGGSSFNSMFRNITGKKDEQISKEVKGKEQ